MKRLNISLTEKQHKKLKAFCAKKGWSMSYFIRNLIANTEINDTYITEELKK